MASTKDSNILEILEEDDEFEVKVILLSLDSKLMSYNIYLQEFENTNWADADGAGEDAQLWQVI